MKLYRYVSIGLMLLVALFLLISCDNSVSVKAENYEVSIIEPDYSLNPDNGIGEKNVSISIEGVDFMIKMNPLWRNNDRSSIYGDTGDNYIAINDVNSIGYFAQGLWNYSVKAYYNKNDSSIHTFNRYYTKIYSFKIYEGNNIVKDFVPCYRRADNVVGLYDQISKQFYENAGTGVFTKGNNTSSLYK